MKLPAPPLICLLLFQAVFVFPQDAPDTGSGGPLDGVPAAAGPDSAGTPGGPDAPDGIPAESAAGEDPAAASDETAVTDPAAAPAGSAAGEDPAQSYIGMDIKTSSLMELAAWCRELGLSEGGTKDELASRLRSHYKLPSADPAPEGGERVITIEAAKTTEYFTLDVVDEEYARLKGGVIISLKDGDAVHRISAGEILYNRTRNVMTATGEVEYIKEDGDTVETFKGDSITVNLDNWSSIFLDGVSERSISGNMTAYRFAGTVISRNAEEVTVLTGADITNPANEEAFWSIRASKLWLLPGNDFALLNAVLKVGELPLLYFPFFYYPADEIIFHPVLGKRTREGAYFQSTTYILGRPKAVDATENSITRIFGGADNSIEKTREGIFLRTTGNKKVDPDEIRLSVLLDAYVNLGVYTGTELVLPAKGPFGDLSVSAGLGFTRDIYLLGNTSTPFPKYDGVSVWHRSKFFSEEVPFRYRFNMTGSARGGGGSLSWAFPHYSDPYVDRDFMRRAELVDWLTMVKDGISGDPGEEDAADDNLVTYEWKLNGSFSPQLPALAPYVSSFSVSSLSSSLLFNQRVSAAYTGPAVPPNPGKAFFFPSRFTMYSISTSVAGTPLTLGRGGAVQEAVTGEAPGDALLPDAPLPPWEIPAADSGTDPGAGPSGGAFTLEPPSLGQTFTLAGQGWVPRFDIDYRLTPSMASELQFRSSEANWKEQEDIDWSELSNILSRFRSDGSLGFTVSHPESRAYSASFHLTGTGSWQDYNLLNENAEDFKFTYDAVVENYDELKRLESTLPASANGKRYYSKEEGRIYTCRWDRTIGRCVFPEKEAGTITPVRTARNRSYGETYFTSFWDIGTEVRPFFWSPVWGGTNLQYSLKGLLAKKTFDPAVVGAPSWEPEHWKWNGGQWKEDQIETHQVSANLVADVMDYNQIFTVTAVLPPEDESLAGNAVFRAWITETSLRGRIFEPWDGELKKIEPVYLTETLRFGTLGSFQQYLVYEPERTGPSGTTGEKTSAELTTFTSTLNLAGLSASYSAVYARPYRFNSKYGAGNPLWIQKEEEHLEPKEFRLGFDKTFSRDKTPEEKFSFSLRVNTGFAFDLQRYTSSRMTFNLGVNVGIANFADLAFSAYSENAVIYRYFQNLPFFPDPPPQDLYPGYETGFFADIFNSFRFGNEELRRMSGFKLKTLNLSLIHHLGDWNAKLSVTMTPHLPEGATSYQFKNEISFLIQWVPIEEIKTSIDYADKRISVR